MCLICHSYLLEYFFVLINISTNAPEHKVLLSKIVLNPIFIISSLLFVKKNNLSLVLIEEIGKDVSGQDKTVLGKIKQITLILYTYEL